MAISYDEYLEYINETYYEFKEEEKMSSKEAIARTFNEYDMSMKKSETDNEQENKLSPEQYIVLLSRKEQVLKQLVNKPLDYYPRVCWYYEELTDEVNTLFKQINTDNVDANQLVASVLKRFQRDCKNTVSEKVIVYTTIAENILNNDLTKTDELQKIKQELQLFNMQDIQEEQLVEEEKKELAVRINDVLAKLSTI